MYIHTVSWMYDINHSPKIWGIQVLHSGPMVTWPIDMLFPCCFPAPVLVSVPQGQQEFQYGLHGLGHCLKAPRYI